MEDKRPDPKPRKHPQLWQAYLWWDELKEMRKRHELRLCSIERGKSKMDAEFERIILNENFAMKTRDGELSYVPMERVEAVARKEMAAFGEMVGPVWDWMVSIRGVGDHTAAKILALFDDVGNFATISKFWRFAGWAVMDGKIDRCEKGTKAPYVRRLKSECFLLAESFVKQQTPVYVDIYYEEKERQRSLHPDPICSKCGAVAKQKGKSWVCPECKASGRSINFTPLHLDLRAKRKMVKVFLSHLWLVWRESEGLPVSGPYVQEVMGHTHIVEPAIA